MIRIFAFALCLAGFVWLGFGDLHFRRSIRTTLDQAYSELHRVDPDPAVGTGKILNFYYELVYRNLPHMFLPAAMLMLGSTVLFLTRRKKNA